MNVNGLDESADADRRQLSALADAMGHPVRSKVVSAICERPDVTIGQVAKRLDEPVRRVRHQVEALLAAGLIEVTGEDLRRGVVQRRYGSRGQLVIADDEGLRDEQKVRIATAILRLLFADLTAAARAGTLGTRSDRFEVRFYGEVDDECRKDLKDLHLQVFRQIDETFEAGRKRVRESGRPGTEIVSALFLFEAPLWRSVIDSERPPAD